MKRFLNGLKLALAFIPLIIFCTIGALGSVAAYKLKDDGRGYQFWAKWWSRWMLRLAGVKLDVHGNENVPEIGDPVVFVSNHASMFDIPSVLVGINRRVCLLAKRELSTAPFVGYTLKRGDYVLVGRSHGKDFMESLAKAEGKLKQGKSVLAFADGTRSEDGTLRPFKRGPFSLAIKAGVPVVPVAIIGSHKINPKGTFQFYSGTITVVIDKPILTTGFTNDKDGEKKLLDEAFAAVEKNFKDYQPTE
jgi:1-acyl-sn-glycerol-3-phosphate acyltransferase